MRTRGWRRSPTPSSACSRGACPRPPSPAWRVCHEGRSVRGVSTEQQEIRGSIGSQLEALRAWAALDAHEVVGEFTDDGYSGATLNRPGLDALRDGAEQGTVDAVLCLTPDRLARAYAYQVLVMDELQRHGVRVLFRDPPELPDDSELRLLTPLQRVIPEYDRAHIPQ